MKKLLVLTVLVPAMAVGQDIRSFERGLAYRTNDGSRAVVEEVGRAAALVESLPEGDTERTVNAYRVEIFSDNTASARQRAYEAYAKFRELCPEIPTDELRDIRYDSPKYTVRVGNFLTYDEALVLCGRLRGTFNAYCRIEKLPLSTFASVADKSGEDVFEADTSKVE